ATVAWNSAPEQTAQHVAAQDVPSKIRGTQRNENRSRQSECIARELTRTTKIRRYCRNLPARRNREQAEAQHVSRSSTDVDGERAPRSDCRFRNASRNARNRSAKVGLNRYLALFFRRLVCALAFGLETGAHLSYRRGIEIQCLPPVIADADIPHGSAGAAAITPVAFNLQDRFVGGNSFLQDTVGS